MVTAMILCTQKKILFVHLHRTGGTTITNLLLQLLPDSIPFLGQHEPIASARNRLWPRFQDYYSFAFVRNPWERWVSWYALIRQGAALNNSANPITNFDEFIRYWVGPKRLNSNGLCPFTNQLDYLCDTNGDLLVSRIGRHESFETDLRDIFSSINIKAGQIPRINRTAHDAYQCYYSGESERIVRSQCRKDIEFFGYQF